MDDMLPSATLCVFVLFFSGKWSDLNDLDYLDLKYISMTGFSIEQTTFQEKESKVNFVGLSFNSQCSFQRLGACGMSQWILE